jgi:hypothetical protein
MTVISSCSITGRGLTSAPELQVPNIGPRGRRHRLRMGLMSFGAAVLLAVVIFALGAPPAWRLTLFAPLWIGALGVFQALDKT